MTKLLAFLACSAVSTASAQNLVATGAVDAPPAPHKLDSRIGMLIGGSDVGDADGFSMGISAAAGYRIGEVTLRGLFDYYKVGDGGGEIMQRHGRATRVGGALRYSFINNGEESPLDIDFWGEAGAGWEHVAWRAGGILDRPSAELAFGLDVGGRSDRDRRGHRRETGYFMAFRSLIGQGPDMNVPATCGGPCTQATKPPNTDVSMFFEIGVHWAR